MTRRLHAHEAAVQVLTEFGLPRVTWLDEELLDQIAVRAKLRCAGRGHTTTNRVLNTLTRRPGTLVPDLMVIQTDQGARHVRTFWLPEFAPKSLTNAR